ncbi:MAG: glycosyltransferase, partial [Candidatus Muiribacteriaceae bacterium]
MKRKRLLYILGANLPSEKGYANQTIQSIHTLAAHYDVGFCFLSRKNTVFHSKKIKLIPIYTGVFRKLSEFNQFFWFCTFYLIFILKLLSRIKFAEWDIIYTRDEHFIFVLEYLKRTGWIKNRVYFEVHSFKERFSLLNKIDGVVCLTGRMKTDLNHLRSVVLSDGISERFLSLFDHGTNPVSTLNICYVGKSLTFGREKGINNIIKAVSDIDDIEIRIFIVGSSEAQNKYYRELMKKLGVRPEKVKFERFMPRKKLYEFMNKMHCFVFTPPQDPHFSYYMSPLKVLEYMATGKPILLSDLPANRDAIGKGHAIYC